MSSRQIGNARNDRRPPRLPKDPKKQADELFIREWAKNNGCSIAVARGYWNQAQSEESVVETREVEVPFTVNEYPIEGIYAHNTECYDKYKGENYNYLWLCSGGGEFECNLPTLEQCRQAKDEWLAKK